MVLVLVLVVLVLVLLLLLLLVVLVVVVLVLVVLVLLLLLVLVLVLVLVLLLLPVLPPPPIHASCVAARPTSCAVPFHVIVYCSIVIATSSHCKNDLAPLQRRQQRPSACASARRPVGVPVGVGAMGAHDVKARVELHAPVTVCNGGCNRM